MRVSDQTPDTSVNSNIPSWHSSYLESPFSLTVALLLFKSVYVNRGQQLTEGEFVCTIPFCTIENGSTVHIVLTVSICVCITSLLNNSIVNFFSAKDIVFPLAALQWTPPRGFTVFISGILMQLWYSSRAITIFGGWYLYRCWVYQFRAGQSFVLIGEMVTGWPLSALLPNRITRHQ